MSTPTNDMRQSYALQQGWLAGGATLLLFAVVYVFDKSLFLHPLVWWGSLMVYLFFMYRAAIPAAELTFREKVRAPFITFVLANGLFYLFYYLMIAQLDPDLQDIQWELLQASENLPEEATRESVVPTLAGTFLQYARSLIFGFGLAAGLTWWRNR